MVASSARLTEFYEALPSFSLSLSLFLFVSEYRESSSTRSFRPRSLFFFFFFFSFLLVGSGWFFFFSTEFFPPVRMEFTGFPTEYSAGSNHNFYEVSDRVLFFFVPPTYLRCPFRPVLRFFFRCCTELLLLLPRIYWGVCSFRPSGGNVVRCCVNCAFSSFIFLFFFLLFLLIFFCCCCRCFCFVFRLRGCASGTAVHRPTIGRFTIQLIFLLFKKKRPPIDNELIKKKKRDEPLRGDV